MAYGKRSSLKYVRISHLRLHAGYNKVNKSDEKNAGDERYSRVPIMSRLEVKYLFNEQLLLEVDLKLENRIELLVPDEKLEKNYEGFDYQLRLDGKIGKGWLAGISFGRAQEKRWQDSTESPDYIDQLMGLNGFEIYAGVELTENDYLTF